MKTNYIDLTLLNFAPNCFLTQLQKRQEELERRARELERREEELRNAPYNGDLFILKLVLSTSLFLSHLLTFKLNSFPLCTSLTRSKVQLSEN